MSARRRPEWARTVAELRALGDERVGQALEIIAGLEDLLAARVSNRADAWAAADLALRRLEKAGYR